MCVCPCVYVHMFACAGVRHCKRQKVKAGEEGHSYMSVKLCLSVPVYVTFWKRLEERDGKRAFTLHSFHQTKQQHLKDFCTKSMQQDKQQFVRTTPKHNLLCIKHKSTKQSLQLLNKKREEISMGVWGHAPAEKV